MLEELLSDLRAELGAEVSWCFPDAPHPARGPASPFTRRRWPEVPCFEWWNAVRHADGRCEYEGFEPSLERAAAKLREDGPFDVLLGYSQGAVLATLLASWALASGAVSPASLAVVLLSSGPRPRDARLRGRLGAPIDLPCCLVDGGDSDLSLAFRDDVRELWSPGRRQLWSHVEGHVPPTRRSPEVLSAVAHFVRGGAQSVASGAPGAAG